MPPPPSHLASLMQAVETDVESLRKYEALGELIHTGVCRTDAWSREFTMSSNAPKACRRRLDREGGSIAPIACR